MRVGGHVRTRNGDFYKSAVGAAVRDPAGDAVADTSGAILSVWRLSSCAAGDESSVGHAVVNVPFCRVDHFRFGVAVLYVGQVLRFYGSDEPRAKVRVRVI